MSPVSDVTAFRAHYWKLDWFLKAVRLAVQEAIKTGGVFDFLAHPSCLVVEDPSFEVVKLICDLVKDAGDTAAVRPAPGPMLVCIPDTGACASAPGGARTSALQSTVVARRACGAREDRPER